MGNFVLWILYIYFALWNIHAKQMKTKEIEERILFSGKIFSNKKTSNSVSRPLSRMWLKITKSKPKQASRFTHLAQTG